MYGHVSVEDGEQFLHKEEYNYHDCVTFAFFVQHSWLTLCVCTCVFVCVHIRTCMNVH